jgi:hypothetical protein
VLDRVLHEVRFFTGCVTRFRFGEPEPNPVNEYA